MNSDIFEAKDYKTYLNGRIKLMPKGGRGIRSAIAKTIGCQVGFITHVLTGHAHFSLEQAEKINSILGHTKEESHFFLLLVQYTRAGTMALKNYYLEQMEQAIERRLSLKNRLGIKTKLNIEDQNTYYSAWYYAAIHMAVSLPRFQTREALSKYFHLPLEKVSAILEFLTSVGLVVKNGERFNIGEVRIHLGNDSPLIAKHHSNWRMQAIQALDKEKTNDLHFSLIMGISEEDALKIRALLVKNIEQINQILKDSKETGIHCLALDFFGL